MDESWLRVNIEYGHYSWCRGVDQITDDTITLWRERPINNNTVKKVVAFVFDQWQFKIFWDKIQNLSVHTKRSWVCTRRFWILSKKILNCHWSKSNKTYFFYSAVKYELRCTPYISSLILKRHSRFQNVPGHNLIRYLRPPPNWFLRRASGAIPPSRVAS